MNVVPSYYSLLYDTFLNNVKQKKYIEKEFALFVFFFFFLKRACAGLFFNLFLSTPDKMFIYFKRYFFL